MLPACWNMLLNTLGRRLLCRKYKNFSDRCWWYCSFYSARDSEEINKKLTKGVNLVYDWIWCIEFQGYCSSALILLWFSFLYVVKEWSDINRKGSYEQSRWKKGGATSFHECILTIGEVWWIIFIGSIYHSLSGWNIAEHSFPFFFNV